MQASVVVFDLDGLSIRTAACYGNVEIQTPMLNEFAAQSEVFEQHYRAFADPVRDRDLLYALLADEFAETLFFASSATSSSHEVTEFGSMDQLADLLEDRFDTEDHAALIRMSPKPDQLDEEFPLSLITRLIEAKVDVVVTSTSPLSEARDHQIRNEEAIRVPLLIWSPSAERVQRVTSHVDLVDLVRGATDDEAKAVIRSDEAIAFRDHEAMLVVERELMEELPGSSDDGLAQVISTTDSRIQMFRKPDDVWNVHNVLVEDVDRAIRMLSLLRTRM